MLGFEYQYQENRVETEVPKNILIKRILQNAKRKHRRLLHQAGFGRRSRR
jgi:regulator of extracellular matrix RemA (YlzA/DUF370 family)